VLIGRGIDAAALHGDLEACLCTEAELAGGLDALRPLPDRFPTGAAV
jgi:hypothetical protein